MSKNPMSAVVLELGSYNCRGGFAGEETPKVTLKTEEIAQPFAATTRTIINFDNYKKVVTTMYEKLAVSPSSCPVFISDCSMSSLESRQKIANFFFEELNVPALFISSNFVYASVSTGFSNALLVDMGDNSTEIAAISEGIFIKSSIVRHVVTGKVISKYLTSALKINREKADDIKENLLEVPTDFDAAMEEAQKPVVFKGTSIAQDRAIAAELYFKPFFAELESDGIVEDIKQSINCAPMTSRKQLWEHIILMGGASKLKGLAQRLQTEVSEIAPPAFRSRVRVQVMEDPEICSWIGASVNASTHAEIAVTKEEYTNVPNVVRDKFMN